MNTSNIKKASAFFMLICFISTHIHAQVKLRMDNKFHIGYAGYTPLLIGSYPHTAGDNGRWGIEYWDAMGGLNFWIPWPTLGYQNAVLFLQDRTGNVGIGTASPAYRLDVAGPVRLSVGYITSDARLKSDIKALEKEVDKIYQLQGKSYRKKQNTAHRIPTDGVADSSKLKSIQADNMRIDAEEKKTEFGYLAHEIAQVFPELVSGDSINEQQSVNYVGLIPLIIEALKQQKQTIAQQAEQLAKCCKAKTADLGLGKKDDNNKHFGAYLMQNTPNPFSENTRIVYYIPEGSSKASLYVYDMQGTELKTYDIKQRGENYVMIQAHEFKAGMYLYALVIDGQEIDTKRMILTR